MNGKCPLTKTNFNDADIQHYDNFLKDDYHEKGKSSQYYENILSKNQRVSPLVVINNLLLIQRRMGNLVDSNNKKYKIFIIEFFIASFRHNVIIKPYDKVDILIKKKDFSTCVKIRIYTSRSN